MMQIVLLFCINKNSHSFMPFTIYNADTFFVVKVVVRNTCLYKTQYSINTIIL